MPVRIGRFDFEGPFESTEELKNQPGVRNIPEFDLNLPVNLKLEQQFFDYYGRPHHAEANNR